MSKLIVYHGSNRILQLPVFGYGKRYNDYGQGFYLTEDAEMAKEWSCPNQLDGIVNCYELELTGLSILNLCDPQYSVLNWLAVLIENRTFSIKSDIAKAAHDYVLEQFGVPYQKYDIIRGYRADDSYFAFANGFLNNEISLQQLSKAMELGNLGEQVVLMSEAAFLNINYLSHEIVRAQQYFPMRNERDERARNDFKKLRAETDFNGTYMVDILRRQWRNEDVRL